MSRTAKPKLPKRGQLVLLNGEQTLHMIVDVAQVKAFIAEGANPQHTWYVVLQGPYQVGKIGSYGWASTVARRPGMIRRWKGKQVMIVNAQQVKNQITQHPNSPLKWINLEDSNNHWMQVGMMNGATADYMKHLTILEAPDNESDQSS